MSTYSGKCDLFDHIFMSRNPMTDEEAFERFKGTKLYKYKPLEEQVEITDVKDMHKNWEEIPYTCIADLVPYYPYIIGIACCDNTDARNSMVVLSSESWVDSEERRSLEFDLKEVIKYYNNCKRKKIEFNKEEALKKICWSEFNKEVYQEIVDRVAEFGKKATIDGIHKPMHERYRKELVEEMLKYEINPCEYGLERFIK